MTNPTITAPGVYRPGQPGFITPGSPEHATVITPSKVAAILGVSRWESPYRLWHRLKGITPGEPPKDIFDVGHDFEPALAALWRRKHPGWRLSSGEVQYQVAADRFGYPAAATLDRRASRGSSRAVVEFKTARRLEDWGDFGTDQAPADYVAQVLAQMAVTGFTDHPGTLTVLGPYFEAHTYVIPFAADVVDGIHQRCKAFYESLAGDEPPPLDDTVATYSCIRELHPDIEPGTDVQLDADLAADFLRAVADQKEIETRLRGTKTAVLAAMGDRETARVGELIVAKRSPHASGSVALNSSRKVSADDVYAAAVAAS